MPMITVSAKNCFRKVLLAVTVAMLGVSFQVPAQESNQPPVDLMRTLSEFQTVRPNWATALMLLLDKTAVPYLLELDTLTYRDMSVRYRLGLFTGPEAQRGELIREWHARFKVNLKNVTIGDALKEILKDQPRYTYELVENGRCLHIFPRGIQERKEWPLNQNAEELSIDQKQLANKGYRKTFGVFLLNYKIHTGEMGWPGFSECLSGRTFHNITLRELLSELAAACRIGWTVEPFPQEEIEAREIIGKEYYERGYDIGRPGSNGWYQIHFSFLKEPAKEAGNRVGE